MAEEDGAALPEEALAARAEAVLLPLLADDFPGRSIALRTVAADTSFAVLHERLLHARSLAILRGASLYAVLLAADGELLARCELSAESDRVPPPEPLPDVRYAGPLRRVLGALPDAEPPELDDDRRAALDAKACAALSDWEPERALRVLDRIWSKGCCALLLRSHDEVGRASVHLDATTGELFAWSLPGRLQALPRAIDDRAAEAAAVAALAPPPDAQLTDIRERQGRVLVGFERYLDDFLVEGDYLRAELNPADGRVTAVTRSWSALGEGVDDG